MKCSSGGNVLHMFNASWTYIKCIVDKAVAAKASKVSAQDASL